MMIYKISAAIVSHLLISITRSMLEALVKMKFSQLAIVLFVVNFFKIAKHALVFRLDRLTVNQIYWYIFL